LRMGCLSEQHCAENERFDPHLYFHLCLLPLQTLDSRLRSGARSHTLACVDLRSEG
jgi:hypothetical protein